MSRAIVLRSTLLLLLASAFIVMLLRLGASQFLPNTAISAALITPAAVEETPTSDDLAIIMRRLILAPEHLAAAGVSPQQTADFIADIGESLIAAAPALAQADQAVAEARTQVDSLRRLVRSGQATGEDAAALIAATAQLAEDEGDRDTILNNLHDLTNQYLTTSQAQQLAVIRSNSQWTLPTEYVVVERSQSQWVGLREALADDRISEALGEEPDQDAQSFLAQVDADQAVTLAKASLDTNLAQVAVEWEQALEAESGQE